MDVSTIIFIATIAVAFIFLRWLISPIPQSNEFELPTETVSGARTTAVSDASNATQRRSRRHVSDSMVEVVATIAPGLTREQIVYDLEKTGSVELTINNYMENNGLPFPPTTNSTNSTAGAVGGASRGTVGSSGSTGSSSASAASGAVAPSGTNSTPSTSSKEHQIDFKSVNLLQKYQIDPTNPQVSTDNELLAKKQQMIINARNRLHKQLSAQL